MIPTWFIYIALFFGIITIIGAGFGFGIWYWHVFTIDNYKRAYIFIDEGKHTRHYKAKLLRESSQAVTYTYEDGKSILTVPHKYGYKYWKHRRKIDIDPNKSLIWLNDKQRVNQHQYDTIIKVLTLSGIGTELVNAVKSSKMKIATLIIAVILAFIVGAIGMNLVSSYMNSTKTVPIQQTTQQEQPTQPKIQQGD